MWWEPWIDLLLPRDCAGCGRPGVLWCGRCDDELRRIVPGLHPPTGGPGLFAAAGEHSGLLRSAVLLHKRRHRAALVDTFVALLGGALAAVANVLRSLGRWRPPVVLAAVPPSAMHPARVPMDEVIVGLCSAFPDLRMAQLLMTARRRPPQKGLDAAARAANVQGAFAVRQRSARSVGGRCLVLVDDVVTTGATLQALTRTLIRAGARHVEALAACRTPEAGETPQGDPRWVP